MEVWIGKTRLRRMSRIDRYVDSPTKTTREGFLSVF
jgi:hypothetical protein